VVVAQPVIECHGRLRLAVATLAAAAVGVTRVQRVVNDAAQGRPAAHDGQIILAHPVFGEGLTHPGGGLRVQAEQQNA